MACYQIPSYFSVLAAKPVITSVEHQNALVGILKFRPNQYDGHRVRQYNILSQLENSGHWVVVLTETLSQGDHLSGEENVEVPLHLVDEVVVCEYKVVVHYLSVTPPVESEVFRKRLERTGKHFPPISAFMDAGW